MTRRLLFTFCLLVVAALFSAPRLRSLPGRTLADTQTQGIQVVEITAKKHEFDRSPIRVKQGARVELKITATDHVHGFKIRPFPEGAHQTNSQGLVFSIPPSCQRIEKHQTATIEFVAQAAGTYPFKCCTFCGWRHRSMKGELIVEP
jgi:heme/copper-type cytochrome/quinol oxidase subunit 2